MLDQEVYGFGTLLSRMWATYLTDSCQSKYKVSCSAECERLTSLTAASQSTRIAAQQNVSNWPHWQPQAGPFYDRLSDCHWTTTTVRWTWLCLEIDSTAMWKVSSTYVPPICWNTALSLPWQLSGDISLLSTCRHVWTCRGQVGGGWGEGATQGLRSKLRKTLTME